MKTNPIAHQRVLDYAYTDIDTLFQDFHISDQGYSDEQAEESRTRYGKNRLSGRASDTVLYRLRRAFLNPFTIILFALACISFFTDVVFATNFSRNITTVAIILCMLLISGCGPDTGNAPYGHQRLSGQGQRSHGKKANCGEKHQRHAGIRQHGRPVCG